ncbi:cytochrome-c peroxidase [Nitratiruptor sp. SB155-2]|uniref:cytochrome-c peroxidase n=1 Tax=Nitratiruptor sp. (strain SB155-2) TaxID=387092 RepID=UPI00030EC6A8|nr:cytochrome c peroxidase [Nitratiruptor sp. SB155-2]
MIIDPIPHEKRSLTPKEILGKKLFFDPNLSVTKKVSCASCHDLKKGGTLNQERANGALGKKTLFNVPSIYNLKYQFAYSWQQKIYSLREMITIVLYDEKKMGNTSESLQKYIDQNSWVREGLQANFKKADIEALVEALRSYLLTLTTPGSKFDLYLEGKVKLTPKEEEGYRLFKRFGCIACHNGKAVGGHIYYKYGYFSKQKNQISVKCPSLRNVALTYPYFHHGKIKSLKDAVIWMAKVQLGRDISSQEAEKIVAFLKTLTGRLHD